MALTSNCANCKRTSKEKDGWWTVHNYKTEPPTVSDLCPSCYRNKSLLAYRDTLIDAINEIDTKDDDRAVTIAMNVMKIRCIKLLRDTPFND
jgi:hypothetical protein